MSEATRQPDRHIKIAAQNAIFTDRITVFMVVLQQITAAVCARYAEQSIFVAPVRLRLCFICQQPPSS